MLPHVSIDADFIRALNLYRYSKSKLAREAEKNMLQAEAHLTVFFIYFRQPLSVKTERRALTSRPAVNSAVYSLCTCTVHAGRGLASGLARGLARVIYAVSQK